MGKIKDAAALLVGKLISRPDVAKTPKLKAIIHEIVEKLNIFRIEGMEQHSIEGLLLSLVSIFKHSDRN